MEDDQTITNVKFLVEDSAVFFMALELISSLETSLPLICDAKGIKAVAMMKEGRKKEHSVYVSLFYPRSNLLEYSLTHDDGEGEGEQWIGLYDERSIVYRPNLDIRSLLERTKGVKSTDSFRVFTDSANGKASYSINGQGVETLPCINETGTDLELPDYTVDRLNPIVTLSKKEYTNLCGRLKTLKPATAQVRAKVYDHGLNLLFKNYADPNNSEQPFGDCSGDPINTLSIDLRALNFAAGKLKLMVPDRSTIKIYYLEEPHPGLLISLPVGISGSIDFVSFVLPSEKEGEK